MSSKTIITVFYDPLDNTSMIHLRCTYSLCVACEGCDCVETNRTKCCISRRVPNSTDQYGLLMNERSSLNEQ